MENLEIRGNDGDTFTLAEMDGGAYLDMVSSASVEIAEPDARRMVDWLTERFGLTRELETLAQGDVFTIDVETGTGARRTITWDGPNVPPALIELARVALGVDERARVQTDHDCEHRRTMIKIYQLVSTLGLRQQVGAYDAVEALVKAHRELRRDFAARAPRQPIELMVECGGATTEAQALETLRGWKGQIDASVSQLRGLLPGDTSTDVPTLVRHLIAQHNGRYAQLREQRERARAQYDRTMIDNNERGLAREREARAQVQAKLDIAREALRSVLFSSAPGSADTLNVVKGALTLSDQS